MEAFVTFFTDRLSGILSGECIVFLISLLPVLELRGGLLAASLLNLPYLRALPLCILGNLLPIPFVLLFIERIVTLLERFSLTKGLALWFRRKVDRHQAGIEKYGFWGLTLFVGIPLPGTGAWTGSIVAGLLKMPPRRAVPSILLGVLLASVIMSFVSYGLLGALLR